MTILVRGMLGSGAICVATLGTTIVKCCIMRIVQSLNYALCSPKFDHLFHLINIDIIDMVGVDFLCAFM